MLTLHQGNSLTVYDLPHKVVSSLRPSPLAASMINSASIIRPPHADRPADNWPPQVHIFLRESLRMRANMASFRWSKGTRETNFCGGRSTKPGQALHHTNASKSKLKIFTNRERYNGIQIYAHIRTHMHIYKYRYTDIYKYCLLTPTTPTRSERSRMLTVGV